MGAEHKYQLSNRWPMRWRSLGPGYFTFRAGGAGKVGDFVHFWGFVPPIFQMEFLVLFSLFCPQFLQDVVLNFWSHMLCPSFPILFSQLSCVSMLLPIATLFLSAWSHKIPLFLPYTKVVQMGKAMQTLSISGVPKVPKLFMLRMWNLANQWNPFTWKKKRKFWSLDATTSNS